MTRTDSTHPTEFNRLKTHGISQDGRISFKDSTKPITECGDNHVFSLDQEKDTAGRDPD